MNPRKLKEKDRRRARKLAEEAWDAVHAGNLDLAEKIIRRAVAAQSDNPVLWNDQGIILALRRNEAEAAVSFRTALTLAPTFAEPYARLAEMRARQGFANEALGLQNQAVKHAPENVDYAQQLEVYRTLAGQTESRVIAEARPVPPLDNASGEWSKELAWFDWNQLADQLTRDGCVLIPKAIDAPTCAQLRNMFANDALFAKTVIMDRPEFGIGEYRYFRAPIPEVVDQLRKAAYPHVAAIGNRWREMLGERDRYPEEWVLFRDECRAAGQSTPTPILLKYGPGGFNALHRDLRGAVFFPIQMAIILSERADPADPTSDGFRGGEFLFCDVPATKKSRRREVTAGLGDAILFCTRDRLVPVGGVYGLQPVKHGVTTIISGERYVLGLPFHEYR